MTIKKTNNKWLVDIRPEGAEGKRVRKSFDTKGEALRFEAHIKSKATQGEWNPKPQDKRTLDDLIELFDKAHGQHLKAGAKRKRDLLNISKRLKNPIASKLTPTIYTNDRDARIKAGVTAKTCNNELGYLNALFNELKRTGTIDFDNPLANLRMIRITEKELSYLEANEIKELLEKIKSYNVNNPHILPITKICLAVGARWSEAEGLSPNRLKRHNLTFTDTKSKKNRTIPITKEFYKELKNHFDKHGPFTKNTLSSFRRALERTNIVLQKGQASHVLRHTFASHFIMNGGNILTLQKILGHASIVMTMRYAHLAPDHLEAAAKLNPLDNLK